MDRSKSLKITKKDRVKKGGSIRVLGGSHNEMPFTERVIGVASQGGQTPRLGGRDPAKVRLLLILEMSSSTVSLSKSEAAFIQERSI